VCKIGRTRITYNDFVGKSLGKLPLGIPRRKREGNIKMDHRDVDLISEGKCKVVPVL
jgi:hypothetical protein